MAEERYSSSSEKPPEQPPGEELLVHFWFTEQESDRFEAFSAFVISCFAGVSVLVRYFGLFEDVASYPLWLQTVTATLTGVPLLLMAYVVLRFYWWLAPALANISEWGRGQTWARHLWFWLLAVGSFVALDPFDVILKSLALVQKVEIIGVGRFNPLQALYWGLVAVSALLLCWYYLKMGSEIAWDKLREWWEFAVSLPLGLRVSGTHLFRKNFTFYYPEQTRKIPEYFRGRHRLVSDESGQHLCIACQRCVNVCPDRLIVVSAVRDPETKKQEVTGFLVDNSRCCFCGLCEDVCPTGAIRLTDEYAYSVYDRGELIVDMYQEYLARSRELRTQRARQRGEIVRSEREQAAVQVTGSESVVEAGGGE